MLTSKLTLCTLATLTLFAQAHSDHLHEALKKVNIDNEQAIKHLFEHSKYETKQKKEAINRDLYWGTGELIISAIVLEFFNYAANKNEILKPYVMNNGALNITGKLLFASSISLFTLSMRNFILYITDYFKHNKEYTHKIETIEKALEAIKAKKENNTLSQSNIEETL